MASRALPENWLRQDLIVTAAAVAAGCLMAWLTFVLGSTTFATPLEIQLIGCLLLPLPLIWRRSHPLASGIAVNALYIALANTMRYSKYSLFNIFSAFARSLPFCHINHIPTAAAATSAMTPPIFPKAFKPKATEIKASSNAFITAIK